MEKDKIYLLHKLKIWTETKNLIHRQMWYELARAGRGGVGGGAAHGAGTGGRQRG